MMMTYLKTVVADLLQFFPRDNADVYITSPDVPSVVDVRH